ncbi:MAG: D-glycero-beta-D-manno-heptose 1-phosphate adenylyltransferase [candidate division Zixibacteria bacterium]|nr:D-glycero-beta-D-manno-heptose 1-phosphate adenylyltransferase [candidate division Zixibacteria bacterium]MCI0597110.1 D-glycero-beta-D-manno-heptose 1-phosphate adenylyltransferase [candidate division Zixibacteria bacterium]
MGLVTLSALQKIVLRLKKRKKKIAFTNGCFDLLHAGHISLLQEAKRLGDILIIGLNTDRSVQKLKGKGRPVVPQKDRALVLSALRDVDYVVFFSEPTPLNFIQKLSPDVLVKGADYKNSQIVGADWVRAAGGKVVRIPLVKGKSSSALFQRLKAL